MKDKACTDKCRIPPMVIVAALYAIFMLTLLLVAPLVSLLMITAAGY